MVSHVKIICISCLYTLASNGDDDTPIVESEETRLSGNTSCLSDKV